jgi:adenosylcobinamide kinase / adenosylcobinamide-phosphate guanylyltransferase
LGKGEERLSKSVFVIGGCRSGKSSYALELAERMPGNRRIFLATCVPRDDEMKQRVARHKLERSDQWEALEIPVQIPEAIEKYSPDADVMLVDCLTLWMSNLLLEETDMDGILHHVKLLTRAVEASRCPVILVSNEIGTGVVPENDLARFFRDAVGFANQSVAACCDRVIWTIAGIPVTIKPPPATS